MQKSPTIVIALVLILGLAAGACASDDVEGASPDNSRGGFFPELADPTEGGAGLPDDYRQALPRDAIMPVYEPTFVGSSGVDWPDDELVIGVDLNGEQRAYPVGFLTFREIVIDDHRGIPTMVTW